MNPVTKKFQFGQSTVTLETGRIARQATGAVLVTVDDDVAVLVTVVGAKNADPSKGFFPLSVHYQEKTYAAGKIPGGFFKREGRPSEKETLTSRLIDRPIRPLFPEGFMNEVQVVCTVVSTSKKTDPDIASMIGTSAALAISGIPFDGPIGAARVAFHESTGYLLNPTYEQLKASSLDMVVAGTEEAVLMVESEAQELTEDQMLGAVLFAHQEFQAVIQLSRNSPPRLASRSGSGVPRSRTPRCCRPSRPSSARRFPRPTPSPSSSSVTAVWISCASRSSPASPPRAKASRASARSRRRSACWSTAPFARTS